MKFYPKIIEGGVTFPLWRMKSRQSLGGFSDPAFARGTSLIFIAGQSHPIRFVFLLLSV